MIYEIRIEVSLRKKIYLIKFRNTKTEKIILELYYK
jgi:hypothetical protein